MISLMLERLMTHPRRRGIVTTGTLVAGLLFLLPSVDSYQAAGARLSEVSAELKSHQDEVAHVEMWKQRCRQQTEVLQEIEARAYSEAELDGLRSQLVEMAHQSACTVRRVGVGEARRREWRNEGDDPLADRPPEAAQGETPYYLETRQLILIAEGTQSHVTELLKKLEQTEGLVHPAGLAIRKLETSESMVALELNLVLMNLVEKPASGS